MLKRNGIQEGERVKMLKILVSLGILLFTFGCDGSMIYKPDLEEEFDEISVVLNPRLQQDVNGYFHLQHTHPFQYVRTLLPRSVVSTYVCVEKVTRMNKCLLCRRVNFTRT